MQPVSIYPKTEMRHPRNLWSGFPAEHYPKVEVPHPFHYMTTWNGEESREDYIKRVATEKRRHEFWDDARCSGFAMGTPNPKMLIPTNDDWMFALNCWKRVQAAIAA